MKPLRLLDYLEIGGLVGLGIGLCEVWGWGVALAIDSGIILAVALLSRFRTIDRQGTDTQDRP